jgi:16S rRNA (cytosine1402-N4)-methyltransferase
MSSFHKPVLLHEAVNLLQPSPGRTVVDGTAGGGGHAEALARKLAPGGTLILMDQDPAALHAAEVRLEGIDIRYIPIHANFRRMATELALRGVDAVDGILLDLGVSSHQLDTVVRGFSFRGSAELDMRMNPAAGETAAEILRTRSERELAEIFRNYGEEPWAERIARIAVQARTAHPIRTTEDLVDIVKRAVPAAARPHDIHPATRVFQALRVAVNDELGALDAVLKILPRMLKTGGRVAIISYHSLEDRRVKQAFINYAGRCTCPPRLPVCVCGTKQLLKTVTRKPIAPSASEIEENPRARSARLRCAERTAEDA